MLRARNKPREEREEKGKVARDGGGFCAEREGVGEGESKKKTGQMGRAVENVRISFR